MESKAIRFDPLPKAYYFALCIPTDGSFVTECITTIRGWNAKKKAEAYY